MRKFYRTTLSIDILSEDTPFTGDVSDAAYAISDGDCVGGFCRFESVELTPAETVDALYAFASDPGFFSLDDVGNDIL